MSIRNEFFQEQRNKLLKAIAHLEYSFNKVNLLSLDAKQLDEESLATLESFTARFARVADIFLMKYVRAYVLTQDPGFIGSFRDFLQQAEKLSLIENTEIWMSIRELRNISAHEYNDKDLVIFLNRLKLETPRLLALKNQLMDL